jgi:hypothetical protein
VSYRDEDVLVSCEIVYGLVLEQLASFVVRSEGEAATDIAIGEYPACGLIWLA